MTKNILTEVSRVKEIMGLLLEQVPITTVVKNLPTAIKSAAFKTTDDIVKVINKIISGDSNLEKKVASEVKQGLEMFSDETIEAISRKMVHMDDLFELFKVGKVLPGKYDEILTSARSLANKNIPVDKVVWDGLVSQFRKSLDDLEYLPENYKEGLVNSFKNEIKTITKNLDARVAKAVKDLPTVWPESEKEVVEILKKMGVSTADQGVVNNFLKLWEDKRSGYAKILMNPKMRDYFNNPQTAMNELTNLLKSTKSLEQLGKGNVIEVEVYNLIKSSGFKQDWKSMNLKQKLTFLIMAYGWKSLGGLALAVLGLLFAGVEFGTKKLEVVEESADKLVETTESSPNEFLDKSKIKKMLSEPPYNYPSDIIDRLSIEISSDNKGALVEDPQSDIFHEFRVKENGQGDFSVEEIK
jgi:hypothetical protein